MIRVTLPHISARDRRTLAAGVGVIVTLLVVVRGIPAWRAWVHETRASATELVTNLHAARQRSRNFQGAARRADSLANAALGLAPALLDGESPAQATAALASYVSEAANTAGVRLGSVQLSADTAAAGNTLYHVR